MFSAYGVAFWFGAKMVRDGDMTVGHMITVQYDTIDWVIVMSHYPGDNA